MTSPYPLAAVLGHPIAHSRSPLMHRYWLRHHGIAGDYTKIDVAPADLAEVLRTLPKMGFRGVNVTLPHKEAALRLADVVSDQARSIGAANTLSFQGGEIHADNTDAYGFFENLRLGAPSWSPTAGPALVLGAGGAARAVIVALRDAGVPQIRLANRTRAKAEALAQEFGPTITVVDWAHTQDALEDLGLLANTTSLGMTGQPPLKLPLDLLHPECVVTDLVYSPLQTPLLRAARTQGCTVVDGLGMLLHQGVPGFTRWFGVRPEVTQSLREAVLS